MDPSISPSFIPKRPLVPEGRTRASGTSLISLVAVLLFITSLVGAGAAFAYTQYLKTAVTSKSANLAKAQEAYGRETIDDLIRLDARLLASQRILSSHLSLSGVFAFLSAQTLERVQFNSFSFTLADADKSAEISLEGVADSFSTIALQSDQFGASKVLRDVVFSDIVISSETGEVTFSVSATVDPSLLLYSQNFGNATLAPAAGANQADTQEAQSQEEAPAATTPAATTPAAPAAGASGATEGVATTSTQTQPAL